MVWLVAFGIPIVWGSLLIGIIWGVVSVCPELREVRWLRNVALVMFGILFFPSIILCVGILESSYSNDNGPNKDRHAKTEEDEKN